MEIKPLQKITDKWGANSQNAGAAYTDGVTSPRRPWAASAAAADNARKAGLAAADARNAFVNGVNAAGDSKWANRAKTLGPSRFSAGVLVAKPEYTAGFQKYHQVIAGLVLQPRGPKGDPSNINRVSAIAAALHAAKQQG